MVASIPWVVGALALCVCVVYAKEEEFNVYSTLRKSNFSVQLKSSITFAARPRYLSTSGEWVTVRWKYVNEPSEKDWIGVFTPPIDDVYPVNPSEHAPIKWKYAYFSSTHLSYGYGKVKFRLVNMRYQVIFGFFSGGLNDPTLVAYSNTVRFYNYNEPLHPHISLTGDETEMRLQWSSKSANMPVVYYGQQSGYYDHVRLATSSTYTADDMCESPAIDYGFLDPGSLNTVDMTNLEPGEVYYYMFGDTYGWSQEYNFTAAPKSGSSSTIRVIAFGDMGCGEIDGSYREQLYNPSLNTTDRLLEELDGTDFLMHIGDMSYAQGYAAIWDAFFDQLGVIAATKPYMVCIGNHERNTPDTMPGLFNNSEAGGECGIPHDMRFPMPVPALDERWYGVAYGPVHFVFMSTEHVFWKGSKQYKWLKNYMETKVNRTATPWLVFIGHRPMYIATTNYNEPDGHMPVALELQEHIEPLLIENKVDLALWAHHHSWQRFCKIYQDKCDDENGVYHAVIGMGGKELCDEIPDEEDMPEWVDYLDYTHYGYTWLIANQTHLSLELVLNQDNKIHDGLYIQKNDYYQDNDM
jgi:hypothetical protein